MYILIDGSINLVRMIKHCCWLFIFITSVSWCNAKYRSSGSWQPMAMPTSQPPRPVCNSHCNQGPLICYRGQTVNKCYTNCLGKVYICIFIIYFVVQ